LKARLTIGRFQWNGLISKPGWEDLDGAITPLFREIQEFRGEERVQEFDKSELCDRNGRLLKGGALFNRIERLKRERVETLGGGSSDETLRALLPGVTDQEATQRIEALQGQLGWLEVQGQRSSLLRSAFTGVGGIE
jgi:hypothetical protein